MRTNSRKTLHYFGMILTSVSVQGPGTRACEDFQEFLICLSVYCHGFPWWLRGKESACQCRRHKFHLRVGKIPPGKEMAMPSSILAWEIPWTEEPAKLESMESQRVRHDLATEQQQQGALKSSDSTPSSNTISSELDTEPRFLTPESEVLPVPGCSWNRMTFHSQKYSAGCSVSKGWEDGSFMVISQGKQSSGLP